MRIRAPYPFIAAAALAVFATLAGVTSAHAAGAKPVPAPAAAPALPDRAYWLNAKQHFAIHPLGANVYAIAEPRFNQQNVSFLFVGDRDALLFDPTNNDNHAITEAVEELTKKHVIALPSHLHFDHIGAIDRYGDVAMIDVDYTRRLVGSDGKVHIPPDVHKGASLGFESKPFKVSHWLKPGHKIELGNIELEVALVPGHTPDSVLLIDRANNRLFAGDFLYKGVMLAHLSESNLDDYQRSVNETLALMDDKTLLYGAHTNYAAGEAYGLSPMNRADVQKVADTIAAIKQGTAPTEPLNPLYASFGTGDPSIKQFKIDGRTSLIAPQPPVPATPQPAH